MQARLPVLTQRPKHLEQLALLRLNVEQIQFVETVLAVMAEVVVGGVHELGCAWQKLRGGEVR